MKDQIIFLSSKNPYKKSDWSGIPFFLYQELSAQYTVEYVPLPSFNLLKRLGYYFSKAFSFTFGKKYVFDYGITVAFLYGLVGSRKLKNKSATFIFSPAGLTETAFIKTKIPIITYGDCSTMQLVDYYPALKNVSHLSQWEIKLVEKRALQKSKLSFFSSAWASDFVKAHYGKECGVIPFGSNISVSQGSIPSKKLLSERINLLFIGVDWTRKGGDMALKVHQHLLRNNIQSQLIIVGVHVPDGVDIPEHVRVISHLNKDSQAGLDQFKELFTQADFLLLPTIADCTPIVIAEAYAFGVPVLANNTGGIPSMVLNQVTGYLVEGNEESGYVSKIEELVSTPLKYQELSNNCLQFSSSTFNWRSAIVNLKKIASDA